MAYKINLKFKGKCPKHPRFNPDDASVPTTGCDVCDALWCIRVYGRVVQRKIEWLADQVPAPKAQDGKTKTNKEQETQ